MDAALVVSLGDDQYYRHQSPSRPSDFALHYTENAILTALLETALNGRSAWDQWPVKIQVGNCVAGSGGLVSLGLAPAARGPWAAPTKAG